MELMIKRFTIFWINVEVLILTVLFATVLTNFLDSIFHSWYILLFTVPVCFFHGYIFGGICDKFTEMILKYED